MIAVLSISLRLNCYSVASILCTISINLLNREKNSLDLLVLSYLFSFIYTIVLGIGKFFFKVSNRKNNGLTLLFEVIFSAMCSNTFLKACLTYSHLKLYKPSATNFSALWTNTNKNTENPWKILELKSMISKIKISYRN